MPTEHITYSFKFDELSDEAKTVAVETVAGKLSGDWWDSADIECVSEAVVYHLAEAFKSPGWDTFGEGDFPGIAGVTLDGWDVDRGSYVAVSGRLDRDNAPALPWVESIDCVRLESSAYGTSVGVEADEAEGVDDMQDAVRDALNEALITGRRVVEYIGSEENAREWIDNHEPDFHANGRLF